MAAAENAALIQRFYDEGWNANNLDVYDELVTPTTSSTTRRCPASSPAARASRC